MNDERLGRDIGAFYRETDVTPPDSQESARQVAARLGRTPQVKRRRWLPAWWLRATGAHAADQTTERQPTPVPATDGHIPTVNGRTRLMFSPVKAIIGGALVFAIGGAFLIAQPVDRQGTVPGAEEGVDFGTGVVITRTEMGGSEPEAVRDPAGYWVTDGAVYRSTWDATDARLSGAETYTGRWHMYSLPSIQLEAVAMTVTNDEGRWVGTGRGIYSPNAEFGNNLWVILEGEGNYEGLTAYVTFDIAREPDTGRGFIIDDAMPPFPEPTE